MAAREVYLIRHGQASFGAENYDELSDLGHRQAALVGTVLRSRLDRVERVLTGSMRRHRQTADACLDALGVKAEVGEDAGWDEYDHREVLRAFEPRYADHEVLVSEILAADHPGRFFERMFGQAVQRWTCGEYDAEYAEAWPAFCTRVEGSLARLAEGEPAPGAVLVFTSGGPIAVACQRLLGIPPTEGFRLANGIANASLTKLVWRRGRYHLASFNEHSHFAGEHADHFTIR